LDIYHIPGLNYTYSGFGGALREREGGTIIPVEKRIGVFYDVAGNAFRVNGKIEGRKIEFYFDLATPNQRWDELRGRKFIYYLDPTQDIMTGFHWDAIDKSFGGYATKASSFIAHGTAPSNIESLIHSSWTMKWGDRSGVVTCRVGEDASRVNGTFNYGTGSSPFSIWYDAPDHNLLNIRVGTSTMKAKFLNHEQGIICGYDNVLGKILLLYKM